MFPIIVSYTLGLMHYSTFNDVVPVDSDIGVPARRRTCYKRLTLKCAKTYRN